VAVRTRAALEDRSVHLMSVGGASGVAGAADRRRVEALIEDLGLGYRVTFVPPQPHHALSTYYRAANVVLMPSRSESFGLVALEAAACGIPVVAAAVGGLRTLIDDGVTGHLIETRDPLDYAAAVNRIITDPVHGAALGAAGAVAAGRYPWSGLAIRLQRIYQQCVSERALVDCS